MKAKHEWEERYRQKNTPWDTGRPDIHLMNLLSGWPNFSGKVLEVGCGTGTNSVWLAEQGFQVTGMDISAGAIELARKRAADKKVECRFLAEDFLTYQLAGRQFALLVDRACFHVMGDDERRSLFVKQAASCLEPGGLWFCMVGNSDQILEGEGPPRLSATQICAAAEPAFEILRLETCQFDSNLPVAMRFWLCLMRVRKS
ncbi:class I SAM-dependent methyltransferase [Desulfobulbus sp. F4]|nr:class I SAM-dependent methyltransferase [Desulfobulbus sp. F4]